MDMTDTRLVVATAGLHVAIFDLRRLEEPEQIRMSSLKHQTRCVRCFPDGSGSSTASVCAPCHCDHHAQATRCPPSRAVYH